MTGPDDSATARAATAAKSAAAGAQAKAAEVAGTVSTAVLLASFADHWSQAPPVEQL